MPAAWPFVLRFLLFVGLRGLPLGVSARGGPRLLDSPVRFRRVRSMCLRRLCLAVGVVLRSRGAGRRVALLVAESGVPLSCFLAGFAFGLPGTGLRFVVAVECLDRFGIRLSVIISSMQSGIVLRCLDA